MLEDDREDRLESLLEDRDELEKLGRLCRVELEKVTQVHVKKKSWYRCMGNGDFEE